MLRVNVLKLIMLIDNYWGDNDDHEEDQTDRSSDISSKSLELVQRPHVENLIEECISMSKSIYQKLKGQQSG